MLPDEQQQNALRKSAELKNGLKAYVDSLTPVQKQKERIRRVIELLASIE